MSTTTAKLKELTKEYLKAEISRATAQKKADVLETRTKELEADIRARLVEDKVQSFRAGGWNFTPGERDILETKDWDKYWAWARKDPLGVYVQRRPAVKAVYEQLESGKIVPGVLRGKLPVLHISKAGKK